MNKTSDSGPRIKFRLDSEQFELGSASGLIPWQFFCLNFCFYLLFGNG